MGSYVLAAALCNSKVQNKSWVMITVLTSLCSRKLEVPEGFFTAQRYPAVLEAALGIVLGLRLQ